MDIKTDRNFIERMTWDDVARRIGQCASAILPIGAAAKQHGFHLPLNTDRIQAEWLAARLAETIDALIWPTLDRKSTRLNSSHMSISYAVFCLKKNKKYE